MGLASQVEQLREKIRKLEAQPRQWVMALRTGFEELDAFGAFRLGTAVELCGEEASGRTTIALSVVAAAGKEKRLSAWIDGPRELYPPAAVTMGVDLSRLLIVRPREPRQLVWTAVQLLRSGAFTCVVLDVTSVRGLRLSMIDTKKLLDASRTGGSLLVLLTSVSAQAAGLPRLMLSRFEVETAHGKRARVEPPVRFGYHVPEQVPWPAPTELSVLPSESLQRPKKNVLRDGYPFCAGNSHGGGAMGGWMHPRESHVQVAPALSRRRESGAPSPSGRDLGEQEGKSAHDPPKWARATGDPPKPTARASVDPGRGADPPKWARASGADPPARTRAPGDLGRGADPPRALGTTGPTRAPGVDLGRGDPPRALGTTGPTRAPGADLGRGDPPRALGTGPTRAPGADLGRGADPPRALGTTGPTRAPGVDPPEHGADPPTDDALALIPRRARHGADPGRWYASRVIRDDDDG
ncbi:MAG: hypothetical protein JNM17_28055 [Archangium sp.]|nr:hypothetical protein [Archangium sp.]